MSELTPKEKEFWESEALLWAAREEEYDRLRQQARRNRDLALARLGLVTILREDQ